MVVSSSQADYCRFILHCSRFFATLLPSFLSITFLLLFYYSPITNPVIIAIKSAATLQRFCSDSAALPIVRLFCLFSSSSAFFHRLLSLGPSLQTSPLSLSVKKSQYNTTDSNKYDTTMLRASSSLLRTNLLRRGGVQNRSPSTNNILSATAAPATSAWPAHLQFVRTVFIQTLETPNPESLKFIPDTTTILADNENTGNGWYVTAKDEKMEILRSPLARELFHVEGVKAVYLGADFVTVTKYAERKWRDLRPQLFDKIIQWAESGQPALSDEPIVTDTTILDDDDEIVAMIKELIESRIRPAVQEDGGDIRYVGFEEESGIVTVQLAGSCVGCPSSSVTLKQGVENMLMHYIPEVKTVVAQEEEEEDNEEESSKSSEEEAPPPKQQKSYEERLKAAGIPFSD